MLDYEELSQISMQIILNAGDARAIIDEALVSIEEGSFDEADEKMTEAKKKISLAHSSQTNAIQGEAMGEKIPPSVLFAHAQDTLMVVMSEWNTARRFIKLFKQYDARLKKLEDEK
ncbi:PTS lactose/cellobiose transporter subunit IIA [Clostridium botulinum]|uniref:PTS lactose/cellobiose transporter subunit IIA n=1 Tax=Clostridium TaxID=1485 RepID=UPI0005F97B6A|nr:PTS lactose/cellobiose transporter subunit IIA [Clostridium sporogenes]EKO1912659.1 PTS lactose/cellobiose transporter subunit IIA [Clostridium botulinum]EKO2042720.1 PTS lactose/cellobiose transporter subunit IIA [Clostridium botulinum]MCW6073951.1 PTS lactose/cellobiose transporter subunit IIA [Clostridium sporogenes]